MSKGRIYIAGPISGHDLTERKAAFKTAENFFLDNGFEVVNPMELPHNHDKSWESYMRECIAALVICDSIALIEGYESSTGAQLEYTIALALNMNFYFETDKIWNHSIFCNN